ncbi:hypothetical protein LUZ61_012135 [Rhynchospora tenuis]|uniref:Uncharacterized protein n=1 Tax=Rhynchospora tenuis TaxID=198213 RepID=A0AAD6F150_9POAL|nr:hypothetical protein LUZ61_012135 [Rhynchospora tenuis]
MAEALLRGVLHKLGEFAFVKAAEKYRYLYTIIEEVEKLTRELSYIHAFIEDVDEKYVADHRQIQWLKDVMDIAYQIEDVVDRFYFECQEKPLLEYLDPSTITERLKGLANITMLIPFLSNFQEEIKRIQCRICEIEDYRKRYEINTLGTEDIFRENKKRKIDLSLRLDPIGDPEVVGFAKDVDKVVERLLDKENRNLAVVSIVGPGGIGKTTLTRKVCHSNDVVKSFGKAIWITISQKYNMLHILRKIAEDLNIMSNNLNMNMNELAFRISKFLEERMYLIVFDDIWTEEFWAEIINVLPDMRNGSRVLVTTRFANVAKRADTTYEPYILPVLDDKHSMELFLKKAVPRRHQSPDGPTVDLYNLATKFIAKCKGLPLALVVLGGLLSIRPYNFHAWNELLQTMSWHDDGIECARIIATSYDHLPFAKKLCFLYFAAFPEDQMIKAKPLLRIWVAEKLIPQEERRTLEETAECFLEDLAQRSIIQVSRRFSDGSIKYCQVHDILRDLAVQKAKEINFLMVCSNPDNWESCSKARRVAIHYSDINKSIDNYDNPNVRSLLFFGDSSMVDCSKYRVLRVLGYMKGQVKWQSSKGSPLLRYLQLNYCWIINQEHEFGEWLRGMKYLETLDLGESHYGDISNWIWQFKTLKHILLAHSSGRTQGPPSTIDLSYVQTLTGVRWNESWTTSSFPNILRVRELDILIDAKIAMREVASLLGRLKHVVRLRIEGGYGISPLVLLDDMLPPHLTELKFGCFKFGSDPMPVLEKLGSLNTLSIVRAYKIETVPVIRRIICSAGGFKQLEELELTQPVEEWEIEMGAMPILKVLSVDCDPLKVPLGLTHLYSLQRLYWYTNIQTNKDAINNIFEQRPHLRLGQRS